MLRYYLGCAFCSFVRWLPRPAHRLIACGGGWCLYHATKKVALASLEIVFPDKSLSERIKIAKKSTFNNILGVLDTFCLDKQCVNVANSELVQQAYQADRGLLIASLHMGPLELAAYALTQKGFSCSVVIGKGRKSPWLHAFGHYVFGRHGLSVIPKTCPLTLLQKLRQGHCVTFHCDLRARDTVEVLFLGRKVNVPQGVVSLALLHNMPIVYHYPTPDRKGGWNLHFSPFELTRSGDYHKDLQINVQKLMRCIESTIRGYPEQWLWCYDRFKIKRRLRKKQVMTKATS